MKRKNLALFIIFVISFLSSVLIADVKLPAIFGDNMVLQQESKVAVWGWADPCEEVTVKADWMLTGKSAKANADGKWILKIDTPKTGKTHNVSIRANNEIVLNNVLLGEVWLCSGQSNMAWDLKRFGPLKETFGKSDCTEIRIFEVANKASAETLYDCGGQWELCTLENAADFSAVGYFFGRKLHKELNVPIGLIQSAWGGTSAEAWTPVEYLNGNPMLEPIIERCNEYIKDMPKYKKQYEKDLLDWKAEKQTAAKTGKKAPLKPKKPGQLRVWNYPAYLYNAMIHPLTNYNIKGVIWYQGEANVKRAYQYRTLFPGMIKSWRDDWGIGDFPFYFVQIAPYKYPIEYTCPELQEAQLITFKSVENTGMVVVTDIGNVENIHPNNKVDVGKRLAAWALAKDYGFKDIAYCGPIYKGMEVVVDKIKISFDYANNGLVAKDGELKEFTIAGQDKKFVPAKAEIKDNCVVVCSCDVANPVAVRFAWRNKAQPNLFNAEGLPASPFRTDTWQGVTYGQK